MVGAQDDMGFGGFVGAALRMTRALGESCAPVCELCGGRDDTGWGGFVLSPVSNTRPGALDTRQMETAHTWATRHLAARFGRPSGTRTNVVGLTQGSAALHPGLLSCVPSGNFSCGEELEDVKKSVRAADELP